MYLKSIEVQGFKSFANKTVFEFHNGVTGIVGPNGSGKSNVADAVRWVLGEQKVKQLRSSSMQDVIFSGTETRKPISFAYVAITLDNADHQLPVDYNEVTIARRVYRSGESEYLINGAICRLRDVQEMFYDTGIGKEGYSIIGQGQIDRILSGKPEERRELFDEAAGIVKFKRRKKTTLKKLENEQANLVRVTDILSELERQVGPLARQSEHAKIYLKKREELKTYDVNLFLLESARMQKELESVQKNLQIAQAQQEESDQDYEKIKRRYEQLEEQIAANDEEIQNLQQQLGDAGLEKEKQEGRINVLKEQIIAIRQNELHVTSRLEELDRDIKGHEITGEQYGVQKDSLEQQLAEIVSQKKQVETALAQKEADGEALKESLKIKRDEILALVNERTNMRAEQQKYDTMLEQSDIRKAQLNQQIISRRTTESDVDVRLKEQQDSLDEIQNEIRSLNTQKDKIEQKRLHWNRELEEQRTAFDRNREQYHRDASRLESLRNIAERYDGYGNSIRRVMEQKDNVSGIHGVVADLIKVEKKYETAIETALGGSIQNIVTEDENTAKQLIRYLKEHRYGRATFLPLTSVSAPQNVPAAKALKEPGAIDLADRLVKTDACYRNVTGSLLGRTLVVDTIDHAIAIARKFHYSLRIVTLEGESLSPGGSMTGGAFRNNSNLLGRNREIEQLEKQITESQKKAEEIKNRMQDIRTARELLADDMEELTGELQRRILQQNSLNVEIGHLKETKEQQEMADQEIRDELQEIEKRNREVSADKEGIEVILSGSEERELVLKTEIESLEQEIASLQDSLQGETEQLNDITVKEAQMNQQISFACENMQREAEEILRLKQQKEQLTEDSKNSASHIAEREEEIASLRQQIENSGSVRTGLTDEIQSRQQKKDAMAAEQRGFFDRREELADILGRLDKEIFRLEDRMTKLNDQNQRLTDYMWAEYELTLHNALALQDPAYDNANELKHRIREVRDEIRKLGNVNVNAIEEYKEISRRYEFLKEQHEDLCKAEETLKNIIAELDDGMRRQFSEKFADIQAEFDKVFRELFGGGKGTLELVVDDAVDMLDCGINIIAQPPGKKLQNMMQLSGGEKALTAISLLFAIQNLKPSPFCLLDEIEAALDDSNVERFARYLNKLTKHTQFIVITHRRGTMTAADRLYGITMQEKGVSALVSVNLVEADLDD